ncbi:hypothetical protein RAG19_26535, partial [Klebsiella pneumoniae]
CLNVYVLLRAQATKQADVPNTLDQDDDENKARKNWLILYVLDLKNFCALSSPRAHVIIK